MDYVASMEPPPSSAGALKSTSSYNPQLRGQVTLFMSSNGETSQRHPGLWAARHQTMHQNIKSVHPHWTPIFWYERWGNVSARRGSSPSNLHLFVPVLLVPHWCNDKVIWKKQLIYHLLLFQLFKLTPKHNTFAQITSYNSFNTTNKLFVIDKRDYILRYDWT